MLISQLEGNCSGRVDPVRGARKALKGIPIALPHHRAGGEQDAQGLFSAVLLDDALPGAGMRVSSRIGGCCPNAMAGLVVGDAARCATEQIAHLTGVHTRLGANFAHGRRRTILQPLTCVTTGLIRSANC